MSSVKDIALRLTQRCQGQLNRFFFKPVTTFKEQYIKLEFYF